MRAFGATGAGVVPGPPGRRPGPRISDDFAFARAAWAPPSRSLTGSRRSPENLRRTLMPFAREADVPWTDFHGFRHPFASMVMHTVASAVFGAQTCRPRRAAARRHDTDRPRLGGKIESRRGA